MTAAPPNVIIFSAPSGAGKTTLVRAAMAHYPDLAFSISATTRAPRGHEVHGQDYYFMAEDEFRARVAAGDFLEWEEVYPGKCYGTLRQEVARLHRAGHRVLFDVDVQGGCALKRHFGPAALSIFVRPPSMEALRARLLLRNTENPEAVEARLQKAAKELAYAPRFDRVLLNDDLHTAVQTLVEWLRIG